jgi:hypothetical protein
MFWYVTPSAGSGCLTRKTKPWPTGKEYAENISATFIDRSSFVEHLRPASERRTNAWFFTQNKFFDCTSIQGPET